MSQVVIRLRPDGPLVVDGDVRIVDQHGAEYTPPGGKPAVALCRCGESANRPFCDGSHGASGFSCDAIVKR